MDSELSFAQVLETGIWHKLSTRKDAGDKTSCRRELNAGWVKAEAIPEKARRCEKCFNPAMARFRDDVKLRGRVFSKP